MRRQKNLVAIGLVVGVNLVGHVQIETEQREGSQLALERRYFEHESRMINMGERGQTMDY